jgi:hypothetical protein
MPILHIYVLLIGKIYIVLYLFIEIQTSWRNLNMLKLKTNNRKTKNDVNNKTIVKMIKKIIQITFIIKRRISFSNIDKLIFT